MGVSTYANKSAVDFSEADGLTIYAANLSADETQVTLTEVTSKLIPANTPVILRGTANQTYYGSFTVPDGSAVETNMLMSASVRIVGDTDQILALGAKDGQPVFGKMKSGALLKARTGYFEYLLTESASRNISIVFGETTGIETIDHEPSTIDHAVFDLQGRRVDRPSKGIYLRNGKKVTIK